MKVSLGGTSALLAVLVYWSSSSSRESRIDAREHEPIIPADGRSTALQSATFFFERTTSSSPRFKFDSRRYLLTEEEEQDIEKRAEDAEIADDLSIFVGFDVICEYCIYTATWTSRDARQLSLPIPFSPTFISFDRQDGYLRGSNMASRLYKHIAGHAKPRG